MSYNQRTAIDIAEGMTSLNADLSSSVLPRWQRKALAMSKAAAGNASPGGGAAGKTPGKARAPGAGRTPSKTPGVSARGDAQAA
jgi:hypothetical protein